MMENGEENRLMNDNNITEIKQEELNIKDENDYGMESSNSYSSFEIELELKEEIVPKSTVVNDFKEEETVDEHFLLTRREEYESSVKRHSLRSEGIQLISYNYISEIKQQEFIIKDENDDKTVSNNSFESFEIEQKVNEEILKKSSDAVNDFKKENPTAEAFPHTIKEKIKSPVKRYSLSHDETKYMCPICTKSFSYKSALNRHILIHTGDKKFKCAICEKSFYQKSNLDQHLLVHGEKKFKCSICEKFYSRKSTLNQHSFWCKKC